MKIYIIFSMYSNVQQPELHFRIRVDKEFELLELQFSFITNFINSFSFFQKSNEPKFQNLILIFDICKFSSKTFQQLDKKEFTHLGSITLKIIKQKKEGHQISTFINPVQSRLDQTKSNHLRSI